ncbi:MAG TPA: hypothetical protein GXX14_00250, partial [Clostridiaceae bacterium]|nr:hypothetical protein [Clostridiaceae bacterium]
TVASNKVEVYYDSDNDEECEQLIATYDDIAEFPEFTPAKLGNYKFVNIVREEFGEETLEEFITEDDKKVKVVEREFFVDNLVPMTGLYVDIPIVRPEIDVYFMLDKDLEREKVNWVLDNRINIDNTLRYNNILPKVETWDMHTYTYSQYANTSRNTGTSYPSGSIYYSSNGYSGYLSLYSVSDNGSYQDLGHYETKTESKTVTKSASQSGTFCPRCGSVPPTYGSTYYYSDSEGYSGTLSQVYYNYSSKATSSFCNVHQHTNIEEFRRDWTWSGTVTRTVQIWIPNWVWVPNYTGFYSGTIYKYVRQPYTNPFRSLSYKYVIYISNGDISELPDLQMVMSKSDAKLVLIGQESIKDQIGYNHFILNDGSKTIEELINEALSYIIENNQSIEKIFVLKGETFTIQTSDYDEENDPLIEKKVQYVQDVDYFDNPTGKEDIAAESYSDTDNWVDTIVNKFDNVGKFSIYRRVKDLPSTDPRFAAFSKYSGVHELQIYVHRKPIAIVDLDWDFDSTKNVYLTRWVCRSYDLDHQYSREDKGIVDRKIMFRKNGGEWLYYIPEELTPGTYELYYYVRDPEGVWSDPFVMNFTLQPSPPVQFNAKLRTLDPDFSLLSIPASEYMEAYDIWTRYPYDVKLEMALYNGATMVSPVKAVNYSESTGKKTGNDIEWNNVPYEIPETLSDRMYNFKISAVDVNNPNKRQEKNFTVVVDTPVNLVPDMPQAVITESPVDIYASTSKYANNVQVTLFKGTAYQTILMMNTVSAGKVKNWKVTYNVHANIPDGIYTASFTAGTPNGNSETVNVDYEVQGLKITNVTIEGYWNHWRGQVNMFGKLMSVEPHRFLSLERVKINIYTTGYADKVEIRFSPELEAMQFVDKYGNLYDYKEDFGLDYVHFPVIITIDSSKKDNHVYWEYSLPLANSTKSWEDERLREPYIMEVTAWNGSKSVRYTITDIEITGNIYDLTYIQPIN